MKDLDTIYCAARELPPENRAAYLAIACTGDTALRARLEQMLAVADEAEAFITDVPDAESDEPYSGRAFHGTHQLPPTDPADEVIGQVIGRYKILERLGEGGCGMVYVAEQTMPVRRQVALKVIKPGMDTKQVVARFEAERQALAMMDHPNIAKVLDAGTTGPLGTPASLPASRIAEDNTPAEMPALAGGRPYFVMELVCGVRITDYCDQASLSTSARLDLFIKVCQAIQHAHQKGIIHRDIKPSNILVALHDGLPVPKVIDFGIAKAMEGRLTDATVYTQLHQFIGTPAYMSPEQAEMSGLDIDTRSDIYSLGVLLYELLAGSTPFDPKELMAAGIDQMRRTIREKEPVRPSTRLAALTGDALTTTARCRASPAPRLIHLLKGDLDWIVMKCLEKDRTRRYETAGELASDLRRHLTNEPVVARPPSTLYRFQKALHRNRLAFTAAAAVIAALLLGLGMTTWQAFVARKAQRETEAARTGERQQRLQAQAAQKSAETERQRAEANAEEFRQASIQSRRYQYAADMFAATAGIEKGAYGSARTFLREYFPREGSEELRGFEWRYWWQLSTGQQLSALPLDVRIQGMAWSPDGRLLAAGCADRTVKLVQAESGEVVTVLANSSDWNVSLAFSHDGNGLATAGSQGQVHFFDLRDGRLRFTLPNQYAGPRVACSPRDPFMAIGTGGDWWGQSGQDVHLVDTTTGRELRVLPQAGDRAVFSPDGKWLASANWGFYTAGSNVVTLWDVHSGEKLRVLEKKPQVLALAFSPSGRLLAVTTRKGEVTLWNLSDFTSEIVRKETGDSARAVAFSPDGRWLSVALQSHEVEVWDVQKRRPVETLRGHTAQVTAVGYSPDGARLASAGWDGTIRFWNAFPASTQKLLPDVRPQAYFCVGHPRFSPDSHRLAVAVTNGDVQIVDPATADWDVLTVLPKAGLPVAFSSSAATLLTLTTDLKTLGVWNVTSGAKLSTTKLDSMNSEWSFSAATPEGDRLALASRRLVSVYETRTGRRLDHFKSPVGAECLGFSPDGQWLAIGGERTGVFWDIAARRVVGTLAGHKDRLSSIRFSSDQKRVATTSWDSTVRLWETATGKQLAVLTGHKATTLNCFFSPDGRTLVSGSDDRTIRFWNLATFREVGSIQLRHYPFFLAFSPDGQILTTQDDNGGLRRWHAPLLAEIDASERKEQSNSRQP